MDGGDGFGDSALARLFVGAARSSRVRAFSLPGGRTLFSAGDQADQLYFVRTGRLAVLRREAPGEQHFVGVIRAGEPAGEMSLIAGTPHTASVIAMRDSEILALPRRALLAEARRRPDVMAELARLVIVRLRETGLRTSAADPAVFGLVAASAGEPVRPLAEDIAREVRALGFSIAVVGAEAHAAPIEWYAAVEQEHDYVLYVAEADEPGWMELCARQVDRLLLVARASDVPAETPAAFAAQAAHQHRLIDVVLLHPEGTARPTGGPAWQAALAAARVFHLRRGDKAAVARLARTISGTSVGLVLSGGAARAYAHLGAIRALHEARIPIDFVGGTSMGAIIGAGVALGWDDEEIERRIRDAFVRSNPVGDIAFPMIAMTKGTAVKQRLAAHFGEIDVADLWLPYFCVSSNLTTGSYQIHRRGDLVAALRASSALPGVLPPLLAGDDVLVDGAVLRNFPADIMRASHRGPTIGVDVSRSRGLSREEVQPPASLWRWILSGEWRHGPPMVSLLMRAATVSSDRDLTAAREATDLLVLPKVEHIEIRDWKALEPAAEAGYVATVEALKTVEGPLTHLRHKRAQAEEEVVKLDAAADRLPA